MAPRRRSRDLVGWSNILIPYIVKDLRSAIKLIKNKFVKEHKQHKAYFDDAIKHAKRAVKVHRKRTKVKKELKAKRRVR
jgi:hypothetical protein